LPICAFPALEILVIFEEKREMKSKLPHSAVVISVWVGVVAVLATAGPLFADIYYNDGGIHTITTNIAPQTVWVRDSTLNVQSGGSITGGDADWGQGIGAGPNGIVNIYGGTIAGGVGRGFADGISAISSSTVTVHSGSITGGNADIAPGIGVDSSTVNIWGGNIVGGSGKQTDGINAGFSTVNIHGGSFTGGSGTTSAHGMKVASSTVNIYNGSFTGGSGASCGLVTLESVVNIYGGNFTGGNADFSSGIFAGSSTVVNIYGGSFAANNGWFGIVPAATSTVNIYGTYFDLGFGAVTLTSGTLTGTLADGTLLNTTFSLDWGGQIVLSPIPEPATLLLLSVGAVMLTKKFKS
jgi:hypothetical protein